MSTSDDHTFDPLTSGPTLWATPTLLTVALLFGLVSFACAAARTGAPLFGHVLAE